MSECKNQQSSGGLRADATPLDSTRAVITLGASILAVVAAVFVIFVLFSRFLSDEFVLMTGESMSDYALAQKVEVESSMRETSLTLSAMRALAESPDVDPEGELFSMYLQTWNDEGSFTVTYMTIDELEARFGASSLLQEDAAILERLKAGESVVSEVRKSQRYEGYYFSIAEPVVRDGSVVGVLRSIVEASALLQTSQEDSQVTLLATMLIKGDGSIVPVSDDSAYLEGRNLYDLLVEHGSTPDTIARVRFDIEDDSKVTTTPIGNPGEAARFLVAVPLDVNDWSIVNIAQESVLAEHGENILGGTVLTGALLVGVSVVACVAVALVVSRMRRRALREAARYAALAEFSDTVLFEYSYRTDVLKLTPNARKVFLLDSLTAEHYLEQNHPLVSVRDDDYAALRKAFENPVPDKTTCVVCRVRAVGGEYRWFSFTFRYLYEGSQPYEAVCKIVDIDEQRKTEERLVLQSQTDGLTGVLNKVTVEERIEDLLQTGEMGTLFVVDVDDFKQVNDSFGHLAGDRALKAVARILSEVFGRDGLIGRVGGDEFVVFSNGTDSQDNVAELCSALKARASVMATEMGIDLGISVGTATFPHDGETYQGLFDIADSAMYADKGSSSRSQRI